MRNEKGQLIAGGVSLNPAGKPKGVRHLSALLYELLTQKDEKTGETYAALLNKRVVKDAIEKGNTSFVSLIYNYIDGAPQQGIDLTTKGESIAPTADVMEIANRVSEELRKAKTGAQ